MKEHVLKTVATAWDAVESGQKRFEVRRNDRFFQSGDVVVLRRLDDNGYYSIGKEGRFSTKDLKFKIGWILQGGQFGIEPGFIVFQLEELERP
jgi:hypothetical protein